MPTLSRMLDSIIKNIVVNVAFNISNPLHDKIVKISCEIRDKYNSSWYLDDKRFFLHMPVFLMATPERNRKEIIDAGMVYAKSLKVIPLKSKGLISSDNLVMIDFEDNKELYNYHLKAIEIFNPLREGQVRNKYKEMKYLQNLSVKNRDKVKIYGYTHVLENFHPHITIARLDSNSYREKVINLYNRQFEKSESQISRLQIHEAMFEPENKNVLLVDIELDR